MESVGRGIELLDKYRPGWDKKIDLAQLDIANGCKCVLGQVYGSYFAGVEALNLTMAKEFGFSSDYSGESNNPALTQAWREAIAARRLAKMPSPVEQYC